MALLISMGSLLLAVAVLGGGWLYLRSVDHDVRRTSVFDASDEASRPPKIVPAAVNVLLMGTDATNGGSARSDTIMLIHLPADRRSAQIISIPRDTWLDVPRSTGAGAPTTKAKINAAYAWGGPALMVRTVENFTGVRIDHTVAVDFAGFAKIIDAIGGVDVTVDTAFTSYSPPFRQYAAGPQHMDGTVALDYARQRKPFAAGDFARMRHQRDIIAAVFNRISAMDVLGNPVRLDSVVRSTAAAFTVDENMSIQQMVAMLRDLHGSDLSMLTSPSSGTGMVGTQSVVFADHAADAALYTAVRTDTMTDWLARHRT
jgi:LCP family protein required for cell wall assembly